jgi:release factor glutamine methyltransferase
LKTLLEILNLSTEHLQKKSVDEPRLSSELIISHVLKLKRLDIYLQFDRILKDDEIQKIRELLKRRSAHEPIQYILGETEFYGLKFIVNSSVLIPRHDTEILVDTAAESIKNDHLRLFEIGTGSGCISVSLAKKCPNISITACDFSYKALELAASNAELNGIADRIRFIKLDILKSIPDSKYDVIISNPPYISKTVIESLDKQIKDFEPLDALTDCNDGLTFYKRINEIIPDLLKPAGSVFLEIGYDQADKVRSIYEKSLKDIRILRDFSKNDRVFTGKT